MNSGRLAEASAVVQRLIEERPNEEAANCLAGIYLATANDHRRAADFFRRTLEINPKNLDARIRLAAALYNTQTHRGCAECRDILLHLIGTNPEITTVHPLANEVMRMTALCCYFVGPKDEALRLRRLLVQRTGAAGDYLDLSESLAEHDHLEEAEVALRKAIELD